MNGKMKTKGYLLSCSKKDTRHENPCGKQGMSSVVATVFLIMITIAAVAIIWSVVFPFIGASLNFEDVNLQIELTEGYTVYDPSNGFAFVQISRGVDESPLRGMELLVGFNGTTYKTSLRAPNSNAKKRYVFNLSNMKTAGYSPDLISVAPIFLKGGRSIVGGITGNAIIPFAKITTNISQLVIDIGNDPNDFVIEFEEDILVQEDYCDPDLEDPWGGCPIANGLIENIVDWGGGELDIFVAEEVNILWSNNHYVQFSGSSCVLIEGNESNSCVKIQSVLDADDYIYLLNGGSTLQNGDPCTNDKYYVYDNDVCV